MLARAADAPDARGVTSGTVVLARGPEAYRMLLTLTYLENLHRDPGGFYLTAHASGAGSGPVLINGGRCGTPGIATVALDTDPAGTALRALGTRRSAGFRELVTRRVDVQADVHAAVVRAGTGAAAQVAAACHEALEHHAHTEVGEHLVGPMRVDHCIVESVSRLQRGPWTRGAWQAMLDSGSVLAHDTHHDVVWLGVSSGVGWLLNNGLPLLRVLVEPDLAACDERGRLEALGVAAALGNQAGSWSERLALANRLRG